MNIGKTIRLSVIVPIYNVEKYLRECIDSILSQDIDGMEVILVDDGSLDGCEKICDEYAETAGRVTVIHKENGGVSTARNAGLDIARGKYITFVDSDDYLLPNTYRPNLEYLEGHPEVDCLQIPTVYDERILFARKHKQQKKERTFVGNEVFLNWWSARIVNHYVWNKIFKREIWNELRFISGAFIEDSMLVPDLSKRCHRLYMSMKGGYYYRYTNNSLVNSGWTEKKYKDLFQSRIMIWEQINELEYMKPAKIRSYLVTIKLLTICYKEDVLNYNDYDKFLDSLPSICLLPISKELGIKEWIAFIAIKIIGTRRFLKMYRKYVYKL